MGGRLSTETLEERRARIIPGHTEGSGRSHARVVAVLVVVLLLLAGVWFGIVPGSSALGRYPVWDLYRLADRLELEDQAVAGCDDRFGPQASVNLITGRVDVDRVDAPPDLTDEERAMISTPIYARVSTGPGGAGSVYENVTGIC